MIRSGLIPEEEVSKRNKPICSEPDGRRSKDGRNSIRLGQAKDRTIQKDLRHLIKTPVYWCKLKLAHKKGLQFYQRRSHAIVLYNTLAAICMEKAVCMKTKGVAFPQSKSVSKVASCYTGAEFAKWTTGSTWTRSKKILTTKAHREVTRKLRSGNIDCRIPSIPHSTVQQLDNESQGKSKSWFSSFEKHPNKSFFLQDLNKTEKSNTFSEKSKKLITDMGNTEIFELCETSSTKQCPDCNSYWEMGIVHCTCGRCLKSSAKNERGSVRTTTTSHQFLAMV